MRSHELQLAGVSSFEVVCMSKKASEQASVNSSHQMTRPERIKAMKESLRVAAKIRRELTGRSHSDSTDLAAKDRQR